MNIYQTSDPKKECVLEFMFDGVGLHLGRLLGAKIHKQSIQQFIQKTVAEEHEQLCQKGAIMEPASVQKLINNKCNNCIKQKKRTS